MRWRDSRQSRNGEDRRGMRSPIAIGDMGGLGLVAGAERALTVDAWGEWPTDLEKTALIQRSISA